MLLETALVYYDADQPGIVRWIEVYMTAYNPSRNKLQYVFDTPYYPQYFQYYTLPYLLSTYGRPENVYVLFENDRVYEYYLFLDYTASGWVAMLTMPLVQEDGFVGGCPAQAQTRLWLWSPGDAEIAKEYGFADGTNLKSIEEAASLTLEDFYQQFKNPENTQCLQTSLDIYNK